MFAPSPLIALASHTDGVKRTLDGACGGDDKNCELHRSSPFLRFLVLRHLDKIAVNSPDEYTDERHRVTAAINPPQMITKVKYQSNKSLRPNSQALLDVTIRAVLIRLPPLLLIIVILEPVRSYEFLRDFYRRS